MAEKEEKDVVVMRITKSIKERLDKLAEKRKATLTSLTNEALERFLDAEEFTFEDLLAVMKDISSLTPSMEKIKNEMTGCPAPICKQAIEIIKDKQVYLFEDTLATIEERAKNIEKQNLYGIFIHLTIKGNEINKINEALQKITDNLKNNKVKIGVGAKSNDHEKILLFVAYNKKEEKDDKR